MVIERLQNVVLMSYYDINKTKMIESMSKAEQQPCQRSMKAYGLSYHEKCEMYDCTSERRSNTITPLVKARQPDQTAYPALPKVFADHGSGKNDIGIDPLLPQ